MIKSVQTWYLNHERVILLSAVVVATTAAVLAQARVEAHRQFLRDVVKLDSK